MLELPGDGRALDNLFQAGGIDVMLDDHPVLLAIGIHVAEPLPHALVQLDIRAIPAESFPGEPDSVLAGLVVHQFHVGQDVGGVLADGDTVALGPEFLRRLADGLDKPELLHIARREGSVEVVD